jgi:cell division cycle 20-like protein 1 (cofactor of APC complex)
VLFLSMNPTGETIVTGAGDETLRFWNIFPNLTAANGSSYTNMFNSLVLR